MLGIAIGVASVVLLTSIGEGTRLYILHEFTQFGTNFLSVRPGKSETVGVPGAVGGTTRKLDIDDAVAIARLPGIVNVVPLTISLARVEANGNGRSVVIYGGTSSIPNCWKFQIGQGEFLPDIDPHRSSPVAVLGPKTKRELFRNENALGKFIRIADTRLRVIGVMSPKGQMLGFDLDDAVYIPVALSMQIFNTDELSEIDVTYANAGIVDQVTEKIRKLLTARHRDHEDFTITSQTAMLEVFDKVIYAITIAVASIAGISLIVGSVGVFTMMWISVGERISEIGLMVALGATRDQIQKLFLLEAVLLTTLGGTLGAAAGILMALLLRSAVPGLPIQISPSFLIAALTVSFITGMISGVAPARRAADLEPVEALRAE
jgi:putative ABC transport system permease protein